MAVLKWSGIVVATLVLGLLVLRVLYGLVTNPRVMEEITANPNGERAGIVMALTLPDGAHLTGQLPSRGQPRLRRCRRSLVARAP